MRRAYALHDAAGWVARNYKRPLSDLGKEVAQILSVVGGGIYNAPINVEAINWYDETFGIRVYWRGSLSNWDSPGLALLLIECHRRMVRVEIEPANMQGVRLVFHQRKSRDGSTMDRLPELDEIQRIVDGWYEDQQHDGDKP